jgi:sulfite exporter TauE/SafE
MFFWHSAMMLAVDTARVMEMRLRMIAFGKGTPAEMFLMVTEKLDALEEANRILTLGGHPSLIMDNYRRVVAANVVRLTADRASPP